MKSLSQLTLTKSDFWSIWTETCARQHCDFSTRLMVPGGGRTTMASHTRIETDRRCERRRAVHHNSEFHIRDINWEVWMISFVTLVFIIVSEHFSFSLFSPSPDSIRGRLGSVFILAFGSGVLFAYICGTFISYTILPYVYSCFSLLFLIGTLFHPDSPFYILQRLKDDEVRCAKKFSSRDSVKHNEYLPLPFLSSPESEECN